MKVAGRKDFQGELLPSWLVRNTQNNTVHSTEQCVTQDYLRLVADSPQRNYLGLLLPLSQGCQPCTVRYDAVIRMETFVQDSR